MEPINLHSTDVDMVFLIPNKMMVASFGYHIKYDDIYQVESLDFLRLFIAYPRSKRIKTTECQLKLLNCILI